MSKKSSLFGLLRTQFRRLGDQPRYLIMSFCFGISGGVSAVAFAMTIEWIFHHGIQGFEGMPFWEFAGMSLLVILSTSAIVGLLLTKFCPDAAGSGIPQLKLAYWENYGRVPWVATWVKFVAGALSVGGGASLGREGPTVFISGSISGHLARWFGVPTKNLRPAVAAGAAAGLSAAFNTPVAAIFFVLEEIIEDLNSRNTGGIIFAAVIGAFTVWTLTGVSQPAFELGQLADPEWSAYVAVPFVAAASALVGVAFQRLCMYLRLRRRNHPVMPQWLYPVAAGFVSWVIGVTVYYFYQRIGIFGLGYGDMTDGLANELTFQIVVVLLIGKFIATACAYGLGGCGGIFAPLLFLGTMTGLAFAYAFETVLPYGPGEETVLAVVGMSACLGAVVRAPITSILIVFEMTHQFSVVPPLLIGLLVSQAISRAINKHGFYDEVLLQEGADVEKLMPPRDLQSWLAMPVGENVRFQRVVLRSLSEETLTKTLHDYKHAWFPVVMEGKLVGVVSRNEIERSLATGVEPNLSPPLTAEPTDPIGKVQRLLLESTADAVVIIRRRDNRVLGIVTMRALLLEEIASSQRA